MLLALITQNQIHTTALPKEVAGKYRIRITKKATDVDYGFVEAKDGVWFLSYRFDESLQSEVVIKKKSIILKRDEETYVSFQLHRENVLIVAYPRALESELTQSINSLLDKANATKGVSARPTAVRKPSSELVAVLGHISQVAKEENMYARKLWLPPPFLNTSQ